MRNIERDNELVTNLLILDASNRYASESFTKRNKDIKNYVDYMMDNITSRQAKANLKKLKKEKSVRLVIRTVELMEVKFLEQGDI